MKYVHRSQRESIHTAVPILLATASLGLLAIIWRRRSAPRAEQTLKDRHWNRFTGEHAPDASEGTQQAADGTGSLVHRRYEVSLPDRAVSKDIVMRLMQLHLTELAPAALANFEKTDGLESVFRVGDEYRVLECDEDAILIEVLGDPNNPYFVSGALLATISDFPEGAPAEGEQDPPPPP